MKYILTMILSIMMIINCFSYGVSASMENGYENGNSIFALVPVNEKVKIDEKEIPAYDYNPTGSYAPTAAAIWLRYMDNVVSQNYVSSSLYDQNRLIDELANWLNTSNQNISATSLKTGLQAYLDDVGVNHTLYSSSWSATQYKNKINANRPVLVKLNSHPTYGNRWVVGYGYVHSTQTGTVNAIIVSDCNGHNNKEINLTYVSHMVY